MNLFFFLILISSFSICNSRISENISLFLDPLNISTFVLDKYHPNQNLDINYFSVNIDGSVNMPIYHLIPEKLYFDYDNSTSSLSQLSFKQNKNDKYFNTKIAAVNHIDESIKTLIQLESKSLISNINQNAFFNIEKSLNNFSFNVSYLYHYDIDSEHYDLSTMSNILNKENESFFTGYNVSYRFKNLAFESNSSIQTSYHERPEDYLFDYQYLNYNQRLISGLNKIKLELNNLSLFLENINYDLVLEDGLDESFLFDNHYNLPSLGVIANLNNMRVKIFGSDIDGNIKPNAEIIYNKNSFTCKLSSNNYIRGLLSDSNEFYGQYSFSEYKKDNINIALDLNNFRNSIDIGKIKNEINKYNYFLISGLLNHKLLDFEYNYFKYFNKLENLGIDEYLNIGLTIYPLKNKYEFDLFGKIDLNHYVIDKNMDLLNMNLFDENIEKQQTQLYNFEFGIDFDSFIISYNSKNLLSNNVIFSNSITPFKRFDYIEIIWVFKD